MYTNLSNQFAMLIGKEQQSISRNERIKYNIYYMVSGQIVPWSDRSKSDRSTVKSDRSTKKSDRSTIKSVRST